jgi:hypothetical protein
LRERGINALGKHQSCFRIAGLSRKSETLFEKHKHNFPITYGADARTVSAATGAFVNDDPVCLQATGFVLNPESRVVTAVYSTGAIGRLLPDGVLGLVRYLKSSARSRGTAAC